MMASRRDNGMFRGAHLPILTAILVSAILLYRHRWPRNTGMGSGMATTRFIVVVRRHLRPPINDCETRQPRQDAPC
jgi:hypothetical protein